MVFMWVERLKDLYPGGKYVLITVVIVGVLGALILRNFIGTQPVDNSPKSGVVQNEKEEYPVHRDIVATVFWVGENADGSNDYIHNRSSYWTEDWVSSFGGVDDPKCREDYNPCGFKPKENPFYFALPYGERSKDKLREDRELRVVHWYGESAKEDMSLLKNRWMKITHDNKAAYAQWQDVGPFGMDDKEYVFGDAPPAEPRSGIDMSPATAKYLGLDGRSKVDWQFVDASEVPDGPWTETVTQSGPMY
jgi:hypothetical protein